MISSGVGGFFGGFGVVLVVLDVSGLELFNWKWEVYNLS